MLNLVLVMLVLVLNPYTLFGPLAYYLGLPLAGIALLSSQGVLSRKISICFFIMLSISLIGVSSSVFHGITQFGHLKVAVSIAIYYMIGAGIYVATKNVDINDVLLAALYAVVFNGAVILVQVQFPDLRAIVESFFVESGNIDWSEGFRYRGLASSGGSSLSVLSACMVWICFYLYSVKKMGGFVAAASLAILAISVFFIGRTGLLLIVLAFFMYFLLLDRRNIRTIVFPIVSVSFVLSFGLDYVKEFLIGQYGEGFYRYSLGYFLEGAEGFHKEGTFSVIVGFLAVLPDEFPEVLLGHGFYGGSDFFPWTDSGYARMFLSVGFVFGFAFYVCALYVFMKSAEGRERLFWPLIALLAVAEAKEGLLFSGYASRLLFILMGFWTVQKLQAHRLASRKTVTSLILQ